MALCHLWTCTKWFHSVSVRKPSDQKQLVGGKGLFGIYFQVTVCRWEGSGWELKQEPETKPCKNAACCSLSDLCLFSSHLQPRTTCLGIVLPMVGWAFPHKSSIKIISSRLRCRPVWPRQSLHRGFRWPLVCQVDKITKTVTLFLSRSIDGAHFLDLFRATCCWWHPYWK